MANNQINPLTFYDGAPFNADDLNTLQSNVSVAANRAALANTSYEGRKQFGVIRTGTETVKDLKPDVPQRVDLNYGNFNGEVPFVVASPFLAEPLGSKHYLSVVVTGVALGSSPSIYVTSSKSMREVKVAWIAALMQDVE